jgi:hypothetical protein
VKEKLAEKDLQKNCEQRTIQQRPNKKEKTKQILTGNMNKQQQTFNCLERIRQKSCNFFLGKISQTFETTKLEKKEKALYWL